MASAIGGNHTRMVGGGGRVGNVIFSRTRRDSVRKIKENSFSVAVSGSRAIKTINVPGVYRRTPYVHVYRRNCVSIDCDNSPPPVTAVTQCARRQWRRQLLIKIAPGDMCARTVAALTGACSTRARRRLNAGARAHEDLPSRISGRAQRRLNRSTVFPDDGTPYYEDVAVRRPSRGQSTYIYHLYCMYVIRVRCARPNGVCASCRGESFYENTFRPIRRADTTVLSYRPIPPNRRALLDFIY